MRPWKKRRRSKTIIPGSDYQAEPVIEIFGELTLSDPTLFNQHFIEKLAILINSHIKPISHVQHAKEKSVL